MAKKNAKAAAAATETKKAKKGNAEAQAKAEAKAAKRAERLARLKERPAGQRPNSKQIDIIEMENGSRVMTFGMPVRKVGTLVTAVALNAEGDVVSTAVTLINGVSPKSKKGHGSLVAKVPGIGKHSQGDEDGDADNDSDDDDED